MAAVCSGGGFESFGMIVSVAVGFQYILKDIFGCLCMVMSRKFILLLISCSVVKCRVGDILLKMSNTVCVCKVIIIYYQYIINISEIAYYLIFC